MSSNEPVKNGCEVIYEILRWLERRTGIGGLQPISRDTDNNAAMYNCWWTNKRS